MKYILDFDRVLFNTDALKALVRDAGIEKGRSPKTFDTFPAKDFLYEDTLDFVKSHKKDDLCILTSVSLDKSDEAMEHQVVKVETSGVEEYVSKVIYMDGDKGSYVKELYKGEKTVFLDDEISQVESIKEICPDVICVQIIRKDNVKSTKESSHPDIHVAHSLEEVDDIVERDI